MTMAVKIFELVLTLICVMFLPSTQSTYHQREFSLVKPYQGAGFSIPNWDFLGSTMVTGTHIRLTQDLQSKQGAIWNKKPCNFRNWELQAHFKITGTKGDLYGDGFAIWYTKDRMQNGPVFGSKDLFSGLGLFVDTFRNGNHDHIHPYLYAIINNGTVMYDNDRDGKDQRVGGCPIDVRNSKHETYLAIRYENDKLTVSYEMDKKKGWIPCFSSEGVSLPTLNYFGASSTTGELSDNHDIIAIKTYQLDSEDSDLELANRRHIEPSAPLNSKPVVKSDDAADYGTPSSSMPGVKMFFICLFVVLAAIVAFVVGVMIYQNQQESSKKRFY